MSLNAGNLTLRHVRTAINRRIHGVAEAVIEDVAHGLLRNPNADQGVLLEGAISYRLELAAQKIDPDLISEVMRKEFPDNPWVDKLERFGVNQEMDYIWARPGLDVVQRNADSTIIKEQLLRLCATTLKRID